MASKINNSEAKAAAACANISHRPKRAFNPKKQHPDELFDKDLQNIGKAYKKQRRMSPVKEEGIGGVKTHNKGMSKR